MSACYCDYEQPEFCEEKILKAAKHHKCTECGGSIFPGERYERVSGLWDGEFSTYKTCPRCLEIRGYVKNSIPCFCHGLGDLIERAYEAIGEYADELPGLMFGLLRRIYKARRCAGGAK